MVEIIETREIETEEPVVVEGFPGVGLVGTIATQYLYHHLEMEQVAKMDSDEFPPVAVVHDGLVKLPVRLYEAEGHDLVLVVSELPIHPAIANDVADNLVEWSRGQGARQIVSLAGVGTRENRGRKFAAATNQNMLGMLPGDVETFDEGNISGISGSVMMRSSLKEFDALCLLGETQVYAPDPRAASKAIETLNEMYGLGVDTTELMEQADQIENQMQQLAEQTKKAHEEGEGKKPTPIMYG